LSVTITNIAPVFLVGILPEKSTVVQKANSLRFYFRGGKGILAISVTKAGHFDVYIPPFSSIAPGTVYKLLEELKDAINADMVTLGIKPGESFLFDTTAKNILTEASFVIYSPYFNIKSCLFIAIDPAIDSKIIWYLADQSNTSALQLLTIFLARNDLLPPVTGKWTKTGKQLLAFLASKKYSISSPLFQHDSYFSSVDYICQGEIGRSTLELEEMDTDRLEDLAARAQESYLLAAEAKDKKKKGSKSGAIGDKHVDICLTDVLQIGVDAFFSGAYTGVLHIVLDVMANTYKSIDIDTVAGLCMIELNPGVEITNSQLREDFQSERIQVVSETDGTEADDGNYPANT
jgi:hypothetical protein